MPLHSGIRSPAVFSIKIENKMHTPFLGLHSRRASHTGLLFHLNAFQWFSGGIHLKTFLSLFYVGPDSVWNFFWWFLFVYLFIALGFTGQVKKIWQEHIFFIFDGGKKNGSEVWFWKLQVGRVGGREGAGLVQCSNQGQIEFTCLRFRGSSANCRHTNTVSKHTHALSGFNIIDIGPTRRHTHIHTPSSLYIYLSTHMQNKGKAFSHQHQCANRSRSSLLEGKLNTLGRE